MLLRGDGGYLTLLPCCFYPGEPTAATFFWGERDVDVILLRRIGEFEDRLSLSFVSAALEDMDVDLSLEGVWVPWVVVVRLLDVERLGMGCSC